MRPAGAAAGPAPGSPGPATALARELVARLLAAGVREVVLSPGSRDAPLAFAAYDAEVRGQLRLHTRIDERTAGFLALGMTKVGARAAVVCTSGTAVANLHPAVLEAAHAGLPLVVLTADRPARLRGTGANQTTTQVGIFGDLAPCLDLAAPAGAPAAAGTAWTDVLAPVDRALADPAGRPLHLNVQLDAPLVPGSTAAPPLGPAPAPVVGQPPGSSRGEPPEDGQAAPGSGIGGRPRLPRPAEERPVVLPGGPRTVVVAGDDAGPGARVLAERAGWPLLAEPTSGARAGPNALRCYRLLLDTPLGGRVERVVVLGHPTISRVVERLLARPDVDVVSVRVGGRWPARPFPVVGEFAVVEAAEPDDPAWLAEWRAADRAVGERLDRLLAAEAEPTPYEVAGTVSAAVPPGGLMFVGASHPIRDLDLMVAPYRVGGRRKILANRGLSGIDGTLSSAVGAALGRRHGTRNLALVGDVTFLHDATALVLGPVEPRPDLTVVVVNDNGGSIFAVLEQGAPQLSDRYDRLFGTPHHVDLGALCAATGTPHRRARTIPELRSALASPGGGVEVVEVRVRRDNRRELDARVRRLGDPAAQG